MGLFKTDNRKTLTVTVQGEDFTLTEPCVADRMAFFDYHDELMEKLPEDANNFKKAIAANKSNAYLIAICLRGQYPENSVIGIQTMFMADLTNQDDINTFYNAAEVLAGLKVELTDSQGENSDTV